MPTKSSQKNRVLLILRHAHRRVNHPRLDNGLSAKGRKQARRILALYQDVFGRKPAPRLVSSPKKRCLETLRPIAGYTGAEIAEDPRLLEQKPSENHPQFEARVAGVMEELKASPAPLTVVCSHGDWIPAALRLATGGRMRLKKGGWAQIDIEGDETRLSWLLQRLD